MVFYTVCIAILYFEVTSMHYISPVMNIFILVKHLLFIDTITGTIGVCFYQCTGISFCISGFFVIFDSRSDTATS